MRVFIASPGDVAAERAQLADVISEINLIVSAIAPEKQVVLDLVKWETHVHPGLAFGGAQPVINGQIDEYDIFIGLMWRRFGTPTAAAGSGTEEEFRRAYERWRKDNTLPVLFYFSQAQSAPPRSGDEVEQLRKVVSFRDELSQLGLIWEYAGASHFADVIRRHLVLVLSRMLSTAGSPEHAAVNRAQSATESDMAAVREQVATMAEEYERIRESMPSGDARTRRMAAILSRMRAVALSAYPLLPELLTSSSPGWRLAAVATLQEIPDPAHLVWLANRTALEKPFIGYHATVALLAAARSLRVTHGAQVRKAIQMANEGIWNLEYKDPNQILTLERALKALET